MSGVVRRGGKKAMLMASSRGGLCAPYNDAGVRYPCKAQGCITPSSAAAPADAIQIDLGKLQADSGI